MSIRELRWHIRKYTTLNEHDVFEGLGNALPKAEDEDTGTPPEDSTASSAMTDSEDTQPSLMGTPQADSAASSAMTDVEDSPSSPMETQSTNDPIPPLSLYKPEGKDRGTPSAKDTTVPSAEPEARIKKDLPTTWGASPARLEDLVAPTAVLVDNLASPPTLASIAVSKGQEYLQWIKVLSSQKVAAVGRVPYKPREPWWHHNCSSKWCKRAQCLLEEEWWDLGDISGSASSGGSPEPMPQDEEGKGTYPNGYPLGFQEIAECLTAGGTPKGEAPISMDVPETSAALIPLIEPVITMVISTSEGQHKKNGCCLCINHDHLNGDHEFGGPLNVSRPPGGYSEGTGQRRLGRGPPLTVVICYFSFC